MHKGRLEAFTDGVIAVIITIMVLEMKVPRGSSFAALAPTLPVFLTYELSYTNVAIFWNNHHHMLQVSQRVDGKVFVGEHVSVVLAIVVIRWMDETEFAALPTAGYGFVLAMAAIGYSVLVRMLILCNGSGSTLARAVGSDLKGQAFAIDQRSGDAAGLCSALDRDRALYCCCAHMVCSRPAH
jgi:uncharacterized membrane protein